MTKPEYLKLAEIDMARARRKLKRKCAAALITAMAETDADYDFIALRLHEKPEKMEKWITGLISGESRCMDEVSDLFLAMNLEPVFQLARYQMPQRPTAEEPEVTSKQVAA